MKQIQDSITKLDRNCKEDNDTVRHLLGQAHQRLIGASVIIKERLSGDASLSSNILGAVWRIKDHCDSLGLETQLNYDSIPSQPESDMLNQPELQPRQEVIDKDLKSSSNTRPVSQTAVEHSKRAETSWKGWGSKPSEAPKGNTKSLLEIQAEEERKKEVGPAENLKEEDNSLEQIVSSEESKTDVNAPTPEVSKGD